MLGLAEINKMKQMIEETKDGNVIGFLFGFPNNPFMNENIIKRLDQYQSRSGWNFNIHFPGYGGYWSGGKDGQHVARVENVDWSFSPTVLNEFIVYFENISKWKYSGETDLIILSVRNGKLDFSSCLVLHLDDLVRDKRIKSVPNLFERIFSLFKKEKTLFDTSNQLYIKAIGDEILSYIDSTKLFGKLFRNRHLTLRDLSK
jgi:hypothetical protein